MSRSYKKNPVITDYSKYRKYFKRLANKKVRKTKILNKGNWYRKLYNSYDISDYEFRLTKDILLELKEELEQAYKNNNIKLAEKIETTIRNYYKK